MTNTRLHVTCKNNYRALTLVNILAMVAIGISSPLLTLTSRPWRRLCVISVILTSTIIVMLVGSYGWAGWPIAWAAANRLHVAGLAGVAIGYWWLSAANDVSHAWPARLLDGLSMAAVSTLGLALMGDTLGRAAQRGRRMGLYDAAGLGRLCRGRASLGGGWPMPSAVVHPHRVRRALPGRDDGFSSPAKCVPCPRRWIRPAGRARPAPGCRCSSRPGGAGTAHVASTSMWPNYMATFGCSKTAISSLWSLAAMIEPPAMYITGAPPTSWGGRLCWRRAALALPWCRSATCCWRKACRYCWAMQVLRGFGFGSCTASSMTFAAEFGGQQHRGSRSGLFNAAAAPVNWQAGAGRQPRPGGWLPLALFAVCSTIAVASAICFGPGGEVRRNGRTCRATIILVSQDTNRHQEEDPIFIAV